MKIFNTKKEEKDAHDMAMGVWAKYIEENQMDVPLTSKKPSNKRLNNLLTKLINSDNEKIDAIRLLALYLESSGRDIKLNRLINYLKS